MRGRKDFGAGALIDIVQKGIQYKELQAQNAPSIISGDSEYRIFPAQQLLRAKDPSTLAAASTEANGAATEGTPLRGHSAAVLAVAWQPQGSSLATASADSTARVWHLQPPSRTGVVPAAMAASDVLAHEEPVAAEAAVHRLAWAPDGSCLATAALDGLVRVWGARGALSAAPALCCARVLQPRATDGTVCRLSAASARSATAGGGCDGR